MVERVTDGSAEKDALLDIIATERLLAVVVLDDPAAAEPLGSALLNSGLRCIEVTLRTESALDAIATMAANSERVVGAGTVLTVDQVDRVVDAGARFVVSPGLDLDVVRRCQERGVAVFPGVATATEIQRALAAGVTTVKFFPAGLLGGPAMVKALAAAFRAIRFIPTGGIDANSAAGYLELASVLAIGGSWMVPAEALRSGNWTRVEDLAREAVAIARKAESR
jgi:2-dehydro-3-deoxyphosphogluconate aldolase / (4S)-4-hydroxy-2-oxoglutarate aldolase